MKILYLVVVLGFSHMASALCPGLTYESELTIIPLSPRGTPSAVFHIGEDEPPIACSIDGESDLNALKSLESGKFEVCAVYEEFQNGSIHLVNFEANALEEAVLVRSGRGISSGQAWNCLVHKGTPLSPISE